RMIEMLAVYRKPGFLEGQLITQFKGRFSIVSYILGRYLMYEAVYFHKATRSAENLVLSAFSRAVNIQEFDGLPESLGFLKRKEKPSVKHILEMDDHTIYNLLRTWERSEDPVLADIAHRIYDRRLLKAIELNPGMYKKYFSGGLSTKIANLANKHKIDPE